VSQSRNRVPSAVMRSEVPQPVRFEKKKNKAQLPETEPTTLAGRE
jgi:hypothetical protein